MSSHRKEMEESFVLKFFFTGNEGTPPRNIQE
jgi:hypothetical protein